MFDYRRSHTCGVLRKEDIGSFVTLSGWVHRRRDHGGLIFVDLRDRYGITQLVFDPEINKEAHVYAEKLRAEWVISIRGKVIPRTEGMSNSNLPTGDIEVTILELEILSPAKTPPFSICDEHIEVNEELRLKYRYLDIRRGEIANNMLIRHKAMMATRKFLDEQGFLEIQTPILGKSTPEGARDYLVPSRVYPGTFFALPQSPQIFKQLLMVSGMDRYFQIAQCFRDEDLRADRQPEFTQIDIEMSFGAPEDLMLIAEGLIKSIFNTSTSIKRITYKDCMDRYGTDKPDTRFGMELVDISDLARRSSFSVFLDQLSTEGIVKGICVKGGADMSRKDIEDYTAFVGRLGIKGLAWMKMQEGELASNIAKFFGKDILEEMIQRLNIEDGDLLFMVADQPYNTNQALDHLRRRIAQDRNIIPPGQYDFLWVTDFPLFEWDRENNRLSSMHHPFTSPHVEDLHLLDSEPLKVRSYGYDLVLNGYEIGGGSQRIHNITLQEKIFKLLNLKPKEIEEKFGFFLEALSYGTPPHLGIAFGLDRILMILTGTENIRDVIAFPKTQKASDLMLQSPSEVAKNQLEDLGLYLTNKE